MPRRRARAQAREPASARAGAAREPPPARVSEPPPARARARLPALAPGPPPAWARARPPAPASGPGRLPGWPPEPGAQQDPRLQQGPPQAGLTAKPLERRSIAIRANCVSIEAPIVAAHQGSSKVGRPQRGDGVRGSDCGRRSFVKMERQVDNFLPKSEDGVRLVPMPSPTLAMSIAMIPARPAVSAGHGGSARPTFGPNDGRVLRS